jgi:hypothetical protein
LSQQGAISRRAVCDLTASSEVRLDETGFQLSAKEILAKNRFSGASYRTVAKAPDIFDLRHRVLGITIAPLALNLPRPFDIRLSYHSDSSLTRFPGASPAELSGAFNSKRFPWFKDKFIHLNHLKAVYKEESLRNLFEGFSIEGR